MTEDWFFRILLAALAALLFWNEHILYKRPVLRRRRSGRGGAIDRWLSIVAWSSVAILLLYLAGSDLTEFSAHLPQWLRWAGALLMLACIPLSRWVRPALGKQFSMNLELQSDHKIVREGPYAYVRHPMYSGLLLCAIGASLVSSNWPLIGASVAATIVILLRIRKEEAMMVERFGEAYRQFQKRTGMLFPNVFKLLQ